MERFTMRTGGKRRIDEVSADFSNLVPGLQEVLETITSCLHVSHQ